MARLDKRSGGFAATDSAARPLAMYDFAADPALPKPELYRELLAAADALTAGEPDAVANMANLAALIWQLRARSQLGRVLPRCSAASWCSARSAASPPASASRSGQGVCGTAAATRASQLVADVHAFPGHIACDAASRSELVVPVLRDGAVVAVIDLDSPLPGALRRRGPGRDRGARRARSPTASERPDSGHGARDAWDSRAAR